MTEMYAKCGHLENMKTIVRKLHLDENCQLLFPHINSVANGFALKGMSDSVQQLREDFQSLQTNTDLIIFVSKNEKICF